MRLVSAAISLSSLLTAGCGYPPASVPPVGEAAKYGCVVEEGALGPVVLVFPGRTGYTDDPTLGIRDAAFRIADALEGSTALFTWHWRAAAFDWAKKEALKRKSSGLRVRFAFVGHSWGGDIAAGVALRLLDEGLADEVSVLVTVDAIRFGYGTSWWRMLLSFLSLEGIFPHRLPLMAFDGFPRPGERRILNHINYFQLDSPHIHGRAIETADENHEVWLDRGSEIGHGNIDNFISHLITADVVRALEGRGR